MSTVRMARAGDVSAAAELAALLWETSADDLSEKFEELAADPEGAVFLCAEDGREVGFAQVQLRHDYVEGTKTSPVGYLEGIFVREGYRQRGIARALLTACEDWARKMGCTEFASDCELVNTQSEIFHKALGFEEANRIICFKKRL